MFKVNTVLGGEFARQVHRTTIPSGVSFADILPADAWSLVSARFVQGDIIEALAEDGSWYAELLVRECSNVHAKVGVLMHKDFVVKTAVPVVEDPDFKVEFKGPNHKWSVIRVKDAVNVKNGLSSREEATAWLAKNKADIA